MIRSLVRSNARFPRIPWKLPPGVSGDACCGLFRAPSAPATRCAGTSPQSIGDDGMGRAPRRFGVPGETGAGAV